MKRILQLVGFMDLGGTENFIMNIFRNIDKNKIVFDFLVFKDKKGYFEDEIKKMGGKVFHFSKKDLIFKRKKFIQNLSQIINENKYETVHVHNRYYGSFCLPIFEHYGLKILIHSHSSQGGKGIKIKIIESLSKKCANDKYELLACSNVAGKYAFGNLSYRVLPNVIDTKKFTYNKSISIELRKKYHLPSDAVVIGHIGRFDPVKNHEFLIDLIEKLSKINDKYYLCLCGIGKLKSYYVNKVNQNPLLKAHVRFLDTGETCGYYSLFDIFVLPSYSEGLPLTLIEAQSSGLPCLASDNITKEADVTMNVFYLSIINFSLWIHNIQKIADNIDDWDRCQFNDTMQHSIFDVSNSISLLNELYLKKGE